MIYVADATSLLRVLDSSIDARIQRLLTERRDQLGGDITDQARFVIVERGETTADVERQLGFSVFQNPGDGTCFGEPDFTPGWESIEDHGHCFELVFIFTDDGFAHVVFVNKAVEIDPELLRLCEEYCSAKG